MQLTQVESVKPAAVRAAIPTPRRALPGARHALVVAHRWMGLTLAAFLVVLGLTGSLLAFKDDIDAWISLELFRVAPPWPGAPLLDPLELRERLLAQRPGVQADRVDLAPRAGRSLVFRLGDGPAQAAAGPGLQVFVDPYTGRVLGERTPGALSQGWKNAMPFVASVHNSLALGPAGTVWLGIAALLWTIDCVVGFYLTLPVRRHALGTVPAPRRPWRFWASRWAPAWQVRWGTNAAKQVFDLHRAGGLWSWAMLFVLAWSGVAFNLGAAYRPVMHAVGGYATPWLADAAVAAHPTAGAPLGWTRARQLARDAMQAAAARHGFVVRGEQLLRHDPARGLYEYRVLSSLDVGDRVGRTAVFLDAVTGAVLHLDLPTGQHAGNTVDVWFKALHTASWGGRAMQAVVCLVGMAVVMLSGTGVWIWWRRQRAKRMGTRARSTGRRAI